MDCRIPRIPHLWDSPGKSTGVCHFLLQGILPTQESNPGFLHCRQTLYHLSHQGSIVSCHLQTVTSFPVWIPFISFSSLISVAGTSKTMLHKNDKSGHPCLFLILEGKLPAFHHWEWCYLWVCHIWALFCYVPSKSTFWRVYFIIWLLNFIKSILCICSDDHMFFLFFSLLMLPITLIDLWISKNNCIPEINPTWS